MTARFEEIKTWLAASLPNIEFKELNYIQADASSRKYLRLTTSDSTYIVMDSAPDLQMANFITVAQILTEYKLSVPQILKFDMSRGLILMTDLGTKTYLNELKKANQSTIDSLYLDAVTALIKIQRIQPQNIQYTLPVLDDAYIADRLNVFKTWYLQCHLQITIDAHIDNLILELQQIFCQAFNELPRVFVHLDYHSRNIMHLQANNPGLLDFQDAMYGPPTYDLVSLFQDAYITWPRHQVESWVNVYKEIAVDAGILNPLPTSVILKNFDLVGLQRHIKNLGIFARLHHRDQKSNYLNDIPTLLNYVVTTCKHYPELHNLLEFVKNHILERTNVN